MAEAEYDLDSEVEDDLADKDIFKMLDEVEDPFGAAQPDDQELESSSIMKGFNLLKEIEDEESKEKIIESNKQVQDAMRKQAFLKQKEQEDQKN